jgi:uncharacterized protein YfaS (alpha-2-macroglobulin family)
MNGNLNVQSLALHNHSLKRWLVAALCLVLALPMVAGLAAYRWAESIPQRANEQQTIVIGQNRLVPDSDASLRVVVQRLSDGGPIAGAEVKVGLTQPSGEVQPLYSGQTDETGSLPVHFHVPADAPATAQLVVETRSASGQDQLVQPVTIQRDYRLLLSTDKPLYQSGQTIHMRVLALSDFDLAPARGQPLDFTVQDPKGNKVYRERVNSSEFGIAAADFMLADRVNQGNYKLTVAMGDVTSEKTVEVRPYALPKFDLKVSTDRSYYLPGQRVAGAVQADYFFGKPVAHGQVQIVGSVWDVERAVTVELTGETDENGTYAFAFDLPQYLAGSGLDAGQARFALEVTLVDQTDHVEQTSQVLPIAAQPLIIEAIPESGLLKPGVENRVYILTSYPDGRPAPTRLQVRVENVDDEPRELIGGEYGLTEYAFVPQAGKSLRLYIAAEDETGLSAKRWVLLGVEQSSGDTVLLRADRATYVVGETMHLAALTPVEYGDVYLDITKQGQTLSTRSTAVEDGLAQFVVDVSADMYGTLELHAYKVLPDGTIVRDTRLVVVDAPTALDIAVSADRDVYRPGDLATLAFQTSDAQDGTGVQTALGVALVDESVFALQSQDPGFAKLYFLLEQQLMEPFYQIRSDDGSAFLPAEHPSGSRVRSAQDSAAKAMWAEESPSILRPVNSRAHKMAAIQLAQRKALRQTSYAFASVLLLLPLGLWAVAFVALWRAGVLQRAIKRVLLVIAALLFLGSYASCGFGALTVPLFHDNVQGLFTLLSVLFGLGSIALVAHALVKRDPAAALLTLLTLTWGTILFLQIQLFGHKAMPSGLMVVVLASSFLLVSGSYILFGQGRWTQERRFAGATATGMGAMWAIVLVPVLIVVLSGCMAQTAVVETAKEVTRVVEKEVAISVTATPAPGVDQASGTEAPRLRQYFPETLYWTPEVVTDEDGFVALDIATADSITTWRMTVLASSQDGRLGYTTRGVRVFQDFFVDIDLPVALTQGDEIGIPVGVYNYLPGPQEVRLEVKQEPWFELLDEPERTLVVEANDIEVAYFAVRVREFGRQGFQVTAWGDTAHSAGVSDAIRREVNVLPDGKEFRLAESDWLRENKTIALHVPPQASPGTAHVEVKIYPGVMAQAIEGLEKILRKPNGCFEQTTSTTYPNLLVLDYMQRTGSGSPEVQVQAERFAGAGYQRLLTFEVPGGGFSLFGRPPARPFLTAYGLMEFHDMANVYPVDEDLIARTAQWLLEQQGADGTWSDSGQSEHWHIASKVPTTAYIAWTLIEAGYGHTPQVGHAVAYLRESAAEIQDAYSLALVANALVAYDDDSAATQEILDRLYERRIDQQDEDPSATGVYWPAGAPSLMGAAGTSGSLETTALAAIAFTRAHVYLDAVNGALAYLIQGKDSWGTWQTTQATVLSLKALLLASEGNRQADGPATVYVSLNGEQTKQITIDEVNADAVHLVAFDRGFSPDGANQVLIEVETGTTAESSERAGGGNLMYQVATSYYLPWNRVPPSAKAEEAISIDLQYDRTTMAVNDEVTVYVDVQLNREGIVRNALIDLGVPPGFSVLSEGLSKLVQEERIARYELAGRQIIIYLENFSSEMPLAFSYRLRARFPMRAQTPPSSAYDYYNPEELSVRAPIEIAVIE